MSAPFCETIRWIVAAHAARPRGDDVARAVAWHCEHCCSKMALPAALVGADEAGLAAPPETAVPETGPAPCTPVGSAGMPPAAAVAPGGAEMATPPDSTVDGYAGLAGAALAA